MNYIDVTKNNNKQCICNHTVTVVNKDGLQGPPGKTPVIEIDSNGYWIINGHNTFVSAKGEVPYIGCVQCDCKNGECGTSCEYHWFIKGQDTGISARGPKGDPGPQGPKGETGDKGADGYTPYIADVEDGFGNTNHYWAINGEITEYKVGVAEKDVAVIEKFPTKEKFPVEGNVKHFYIAEDSGKMHYFNEQNKTYYEIGRLTTPSDGKDALDVIESALGGSNLSTEPILGPDGNPIPATNIVADFENGKAVFEDGKQKTVLVPEVVMDGNVPARNPDGSVKVQFVEKPVYERGDQKLDENGKPMVKEEYVFQTNPDGSYATTTNPDNPEQVIPVILYEQNVTIQQPISFAVLDGNTPL